MPFSSAILLAASYAPLNAPQSDPMPMDHAHQDAGGMQMHHGKHTMDSMSMGVMRGRLGDWSMQKEGSGTSWLPESSPMYMTPIPSGSDWEFNAMGSLSFNYTKSGGNRSDSRFYSNSMLMVMGRKPTETGSIGVNAMISLDPAFNGQYGYPNLLQTGETAHGTKLVDFQHPHDFISELTASASWRIGQGTNAFVYGGPVGEPALGSPMFLHRPSGMEIPEAPITHHWIDSTHISWGVLTAGLNTRKWQIEGSWFNGHEPDENRFSPDPLGLNSASARVTYAPRRDLTFSLSHGYLNSPEADSPGVDQHRTILSALWIKPMDSGDTLATSAIFGQNVIGGDRFNAYLLEASLIRSKDTYFARYENVEKNELIGAPLGTYTVQKILAGIVHSVANRGGVDYGVGGYLALSKLPSTLEATYSKDPISFGVFVRARIGR